MDKNNHNTNINRCKICQGGGLIKNTKRICDICSGIKCEYFNLNQIEYAPWEFCLDCGGSGYKECVVQGNNLKNSEKNPCLRCLGTGFIKKQHMLCKSCEIPHKICSCQKILFLYDECTNCLGTGIK